MIYKFTIPGQLPGLNEYISAERGNRYAAAKMKRNAQELIGWSIRNDLGVISIDRPVQIKYRWFEKNRRRDKDNIAFARKFIQDALVECGVLPGDGWAWIEGFSDEFAVDPRLPRVEVEIEEVVG